MANPSPSRQEIGRQGEELAARRLAEMGYEIVARNWRCARGEIDLVARAGQVLVFVEVKTRRGRSMGTPEEGLTGPKGRKLLELGQAYLLENDLDVDWRVDLVAIEQDRAGHLLRFEHIPNAVTAW